MSCLEIKPSIRRGGIWLQWIWLVVGGARWAGLTTCRNCWSTGIFMQGHLCDGEKKKIILRVKVLREKYVDAGGGRGERPAGVQDDMTGTQITSRYKLSYADDWMHNISELPADGLQQRRSTLRATPRAKQRPDCRRLEGKEKSPGAATVFSFCHWGDQTQRRRVESNKAAVKCICTTLKSAEH